MRVCVAAWMQGVISNIYGAGHLRTTREFRHVVFEYVGFEHNSSFTLNN